MRRSPRTTIQGTIAPPAVAQLAWTKVVDIDFTQEANQALNAGNLTVTNRVDNSSIVLAGQTVAIMAGLLVMTAGSGTNIGINTSSRTGAFLVADIEVLWPAFDNEPLRWGAEVGAAPTFDSTSRAWGVMVENASGIGSGTSAYGYSAEIRGTGVGTATRQTRFQYGATTNVNSMSSTAYASGLVCGLSLEGIGSGGLWSLSADDVDELDTATIVGAIGSPGNSVGGSPVQGLSRLGVFAVSQIAGVFVTSIKRLVLWARVPTVV